MLTFRPQTIEEMRGRYPAATARPFRVADVLAGGTRPGQSPDHVFDWPDGMRWIVSREKDDEDGRTVLHLSASAFRGTELYRRLAAGELSPPAFCALVEERFEAVAGRKAPDFLAFSPEKGIPHWVRE